MYMALRFHNQELWIAIRPGTNWLMVPNAGLWHEVHTLFIFSICGIVTMQNEGKPFPLEPGSATIHHGRTLHYSRGNSTDTRRRGFIVNCRPASMVEYERKNDYDHGKKVRLISLSFVILATSMVVTMKQ